MGGKWSVKETEYLEQHAHEGARTIARELGRSVNAIQIKARREGISLRIRYYCPKCGRWWFKPLHMKTGWCQECTKLDRNRRLQAQLYEEEVRLLQADRALQASYSKKNRLKQKDQKRDCTK